MAKKTSSGADFGTFTQIRATNFCFQNKNLALPVTRNQVSYHHVQYQKKIMIQSCENLVTVGRMGGQTDESDFIGRCPTNVDRPKSEKTDELVLRSCVANG